jgi:hypothetical protein
VIAVRLYGPNELAGIQTGGFYEGGNFSLLFGATCESCGQILSVGHRSNRRSVVCSVAVREAFLAASTVPAERTN